MISIRPYRREDLDGLVSLWNQDSLWGPVTGEELHKWFIDTDMGESLVMVAVNADDEIVGQIMWLPSRVSIDNHLARASRLLAPIIRTDFRRRSLRDADHPIIGMTVASLPYLMERGVGVAYSFPESAWLPFFRWLPSIGLPAVAERTFGHLRRDLTTASEIESRGHNLISTRVPFLGSEHSDLWENATRILNLNRKFERSPERLKFLSSRYIAVETRSVVDSRLAGYALLNGSNNLLVDIVSGEQRTAKQVLESTLNWILKQRNEQNDDKFFPHLNMMETPSFRQAALEAGFERSPRTFAYIALALDPGLADVVSDVDHWHLSLAD